MEREFCGSPHAATDQVRGNLSVLLMVRSVRICAHLEIEILFICLGVAGASNYRRIDPDNISRYFGGDRWSSRKSDTAFQGKDLGG